MKFPKINEDFCPTATNLGGSCEDDRCADPVFAAAHPDICGVTATGRFILKPDRAILCDQTTLQFLSYLTGSNGEQPLTEGVVYSSSDPSVLLIDSGSGLATVIATGIAVVTATWLEQTASSAITILGGEGDCCDGLAVRAAVLLDVSNSMIAQPFTGVSRYAEAYYLWKYGIRPGMSFNTRYHTGPTPAEGDGRNFEALALFAQTASLQQDWAAVDVPGTPPNPAPTASDIAGAFQLALSLFGTAPSDDEDREPLNVIVILSDGSNRPELGSDDYYQLIQSANDFKIDGGVIVCIGIRAEGDGFSLLQQLANIGFFINVLPTTNLPVEIVQRIMCSLCAQSLRVQDCETEGDALIPEMSSNTTPEGEVTTTSASETSANAWRVFDRVGGTTFIFDSGSSITYEFVAPATVYGWRASGVGNSPSEGVDQGGGYGLEGSDDGITFVPIDTMPFSTQTLEETTRMLTSPVTFKFYRFTLSYLWFNGTDFTGGTMETPELVLLGPSEDCEGFGCDPVDDGAQLPDPSPLPEAEA